MLVSLAVVGHNMNPLGTLGKHVQYLTPEQQDCIKNNKHPAGIDTSQLTESLENFKQNPLTLGFIQGLFDGDGSLSLSLIDFKEAKAGDNIVSVKLNLVMTQDIHNVSLLEEVKEYFNNKGSVNKLNDTQASNYSSGNKSDLRTVILPMLAGKNPGDLIKNYNIDELELPLLKYNKVYYANKILELELDTSGIKDEKTLREVIRLLYFIVRDTKGLTSEEFIEERMRALINKKNIVEDIV